MNFNFMLNEKFFIFIIAIVLFALWQIAKLIWTKWFNPIAEEQKKKVAEIITLVNLVVAIISAIVVVGFGFSTNFWDSFSNILTIFAAGSVFDILKAYGAVK